MKIDNIKIVENKPVIKFDKFKLTTVELTLKNWFGRKIIILAYPTNHGPTFGSDDIQYIEYCNDKGEELCDIYIADNISKQINNFLMIEQINNRF